MSEYFDLAIFDADKSNSEKNLITLRKHFQLPNYHNPPEKRKTGLMSDREMCVYNVEYIDFALNMLCFRDMKFSKAHFPETLRGLCEIADTCFGILPTARYITGIYELTGYLINDDMTLSDVTSETLSRFPLVFYRADSMTRNVKIDCKVGNTVCVCNFDAQDIF